MNEINLNNCIRGQKLKSKHGKIFFYMGKSGGQTFPHLLVDEKDNFVTRTDDGHVYSNPNSRMESDHDIVEIFPVTCSLDKKEAQILKLKKDLARLKKRYAALKSDYKNLYNDFITKTKI